jgi:alanine dehydrogenase
MIIGVPKEIKQHEYRVGLVVANVAELVEQGHEVIVQSQLGAGIGSSDDDYRAVGAKVVQTAAEVFAKADMIVKIKEPQPEECRMLRPNQILFTFLHLAPDLEQTRGIVDSGCIAIAYETVTDSRGGLPILSPASEVAGRMSIQAGAHCLEKPQGGSGVLLGGIPGVPAAKVVVIGGGVVGTNALRMAIGMEANVTVIDKNVNRLRELDVQFGNKITTVFATKHALQREVIAADLVIGAVLVPGASAPRLITHDMVKAMRPGSVIVDVAIDQGGCSETSRPTTHNEPTYVVDGVIHYCVTNMPGAAARTSSYGINNATFNFVSEIANLGVKKALLKDPYLREGLNVCQGKVTYRAVAEEQGYEFVDPVTALNAL